MARRFVIIAHRGAPNYAPENTLPAFDEALEMGFRHIELDLQLSADGLPVVFHDENLERTSDGSGPLALRTAAELGRLEAGGWFGPAFRGARIPTLEEVLVRYRDRAHLHLELKSEDPALPTVVADLLETTGWPVSPSGTREGSGDRGVTVSSFHTEQLERMRRLLPEMALAWLVTTLSSEVLEEAVSSGFGTISPRADTVNRRDVKAADALGLEVRCWGLKTVDELKRLVECGVGGSTCDWPDIARGALSREPSA